ncbi:MAG TPA: hypothetical protein V6C84_30235 [Coleofasciculaceae cyanobacterium]|jgi:hypothetical protein
MTNRALKSGDVLFVIAKEKVARSAQISSMQAVEGALQAGDIDFEVTDKSITEA